jgi:HlyD family secretion protein
MNRVRVVVSAFILLTSCRSDPPADAYGHMEAVDVVVGAQATGQLQSFQATEGTRLTSGQIVGAIEPTALELQLDQIAAQRTASASRVEEVSRQVAVLETHADIAKRTYERTRRLHEVQAATAQQLDAAERDYRTLLAQIDAAKAQRHTAGRDVASADARVAQIRDQVAKSRVTNPIAGTVLATYAKTGEFVQTGQPLYKIANLDTLELRAYVSEPQLTQVKIGQAVQVAVDVANDRRQLLPGVVTWISSQAEFTPTPIETRDERSNLVYAIKVRVPNREGLLKIGMPADVVFTPQAATR